MNEPTPALTPQAKGAAKRVKLFVTAGQRFGRGVVIDPEVRVPRASRAPSSWPRGARLLCDCGTEYLTVLVGLLSGTSQSCGCLRLERQRAAVTKHGRADHPLFATWKGMLGRCENPRDPSFYLYGARGISVCEHWHDPNLFIADIEAAIGPRPHGHTLDRYPDKAGNYEPGNVRWATAKEQRENQRELNPEEQEHKSQALRDYWAGRGSRPKTCEYCGREYQTRAVAGAEHQKYCSGACAAAARRASGADDIELTCHQCGGTFTANRYDNTRHCSLSCAATCQHAGGCPR